MQEGVAGVSLIPADPAGFVELLQQALKKRQAAHNGRRGGPVCDVCAHDRLLCSNGYEDEDGSSLLINRTNSIYRTLQQY